MNEYKKLIYKDEVETLIDNAIENHIPLVFCDTETTGLSSDKDYIIQFSGIRCEIGKFDKIKFVKSINVYIKPPFSISPKITEITGITNDCLSTKKEESEVFPQIKKFLEGALIICHNVKFDKQMITAMYLRQNEDLNFVGDLCTLKMSKELYPSESHKLCDIIANHCPAREYKFHNSMDDTMACQAAFKTMLSEYRTFGLNEEPDVFKEHPIIEKISYWGGHSHMQRRIYVQTNMGTIYFDLYTKSWKCKFKGSNLIDNIDMEWLEGEVLEKTSSIDIAEFAKYTGELKCS